MGRAPCCDKTQVKKGTWSPEEDDLLKRYVESHGSGGNWISLPHKAGLKRCGKSCRLRWLNYLRPNIKHGGFTKQEDNIICSLYSQMGSRWSFIASHLPGRTDNDVKNHWNGKLKKKILSGELSLTTSKTANDHFCYAPRPENCDSLDTHRRTLPMFDQFCGFSDKIPSEFCNLSTDNLQVVPSCSSYLALYDKQSLLPTIVGGFEDHDGVLMYQRLGFSAYDDVDFTGKVSVSDSDFQSIDGFGSAETTEGGLDENLATYYG